MHSKKKSPEEMVRLYRETLGDFDTSEEKVKERLAYLDALARNVIRGSLRSYMQTHEQGTKIK